jgi:hypothetical protein
VIFPCEFLPAFSFLTAKRDFSGVFLVISEKSDTVVFLKDGVVGLNLYIPIVFISPLIFIFLVFSR